MKSTWELSSSTKDKSCNCKCLTCGKEFYIYVPDHFNMKLTTCPTCNQQVWVPSCPKGCPSWNGSDPFEYLKYCIVAGEGK